MWRSLGAWSVYVDQSLGNGCFLFSRFPNQTLFRVGVEKLGKTEYYLMLGNPAWKSLKSGAEHKLEFRFDAETPWEAPVTVVDLGGDAALMATFSDARFWTEFSSARRLVISRKSRHVTALTLKGTATAFQELVRCQRSQNKAKSR